MKRIGYVAIALGIEATTNRTCRLANATPERLRELIGLNLKGLKEVIRYNIRQGILFYRISSQIIPFASHPINKLDWAAEFSDTLERIGRLIIDSGMRVSMHPPQFVNLSTPNEATLRSSIDDLEWHNLFLDSLGVDGSNKLIIHGGGAYGDKDASIKRFVRQYNLLSEPIKRRLVIENDERIYSVEDCLHISNLTGMPVVFDYFHHKINPGDFLHFIDALKKCLATWGPQDGRPKIHFSTQEFGERLGTHSKTLDVNEFVGFYKATEDLDFDIMLEVKDKNLSALRVMKVLELL